MEETKIETVNEATSDNVEEVKEAPKRRGRKPKVESTEEVKLENTVQEVQPEFTVEEFIDESNTEESKSDPLVLETEFESEPEAKDSHEESDESLEELCTLPSSINLTKPIMFYASPTLHRASGFVKGTLIIKEELQKFVKVQFVIPELGRTAGYVLKSDLVSRM